MFRIFGLKRNRVGTDLYNAEIFCVYFHGIFFCELRILLKKDNICDINNLS